MHDCIFFGSLVAVISYTVGMFVGGAIVRRSRVPGQ